MGVYAVADVTRATVSLIALAVALLAGVRAPAALLALWGIGPIAGALPLLTLAHRRQPARPRRGARRSARRSAARCAPTPRTWSASPWRGSTSSCSPRSRRGPQVAYYSLAMVIAEAAWLLPSAFAVTSLSDYVRLPGREAWQAARRALPRTVAAAGASGVVAGAGGVLAIVLLLPDAYDARSRRCGSRSPGWSPTASGTSSRPTWSPRSTGRRSPRRSRASRSSSTWRCCIALGGPHGAVGAAIASTTAYALHAALNLGALSREGRRATAR